MIQFNKLHITSGKYLTIDVSICDDRYYEGIYIDSVIIDTQDTYVGSGPSSNPVYTYTVPKYVEILNPRNTEVSALRFTEDGKLRLVEDESATAVYGVKHLTLTLDATDLGSLDNLFFVYVKARGVVAPDTPCGMDTMIDMRPVLDWYPLYQQAMNYLKELGESCTTPQNFIDFILKLKGLEIALKSKNYPEAIDYYNKFFKNSKFTYSNKKKGGCGCGHY